MAFFTHRISFKKIDPLGDGLREQIEAERLEPEAIRLYETPTEEEQLAYWAQFEKDMRSDDDHLRFTQD